MSKNLLIENVIPYKLQIEIFVTEATILLDIREQPVIVVGSSQIKKGEKYIDTFKKEIRTAQLDLSEDTPYLKLLATRDQFSPRLLNDIAKKIYKNKDKVYLACVQNLNSHGKDWTIKIDNQQYISIYPVKEPKEFTKEEFKKGCWAAWCATSGVNEDGGYTVAFENWYSRVF